MPNNKKNKNKKKTTKVTVVVPPKQKSNKKRKRTKAGQAGSVVAEIGSLLGMPALGRGAGKLVNRIFGQGDYVLNAPKQNSLMGQGPPSFSPLTSGFRLSHREYIKDMTSSINFDTESFPINPGLPALFPWLSTVAANFEEYVIHGMVVYLNTTSGTAVSSTNTALGLWGAVTQYDPDDPDFINKQQCENYVGCQSAVPFHSLMHGIECAPQSNVLNRKYVRTGDIDSELKFYDWGKFQYFSQGSQASNTIGEMWVSYDISFYKPRLPQHGTLSGADSYRRVGGAFGTTNMFGTLIEPTAVGSALGTTLQNSNLIIPEGLGTGIYLVTAEWDSLTAASTGTLGVVATGSVSENTTAMGSFIQTPSVSDSSFRKSIIYCFNKSTLDAGNLAFSSTGSWVSQSYRVNVVRLNSDLGVPLTRIHLNKHEIDSVRGILDMLNNGGLDKLVELLKPQQGLLSDLDSSRQTIVVSKDQQG